MTTSTPSKVFIMLNMLLFLSSCGGMGSQDETAESTQILTSATNAKLIFSDSFEGGKAMPSWTEVNFIEPNYINVPKFVNKAGKWAAHYHLLGGDIAENEQQPLTLLKQDFTDWAGSKSLDEIYIEHSEYWESDYDFPTGSQKMLRIGRFVEYTPDGPFLDFWNQVSNTNIQIFHYFKGDNSSTENEYFNNTNNGIETGRWIRFANWVKLNTPGKSDGFVRSYRDGNLIASIENADLRGNSTKGYEFFWLGGNATYWQPEMTGRAANPLSNSSRYISDIRVYTTQP